MKAGVPDILIFSKTCWPSCRGLAIELKVGRNNLTESQKQWQQGLHHQGWHAVVCRTLDEVIEVLDRYGLWKRGKA